MILGQHEYPPHSTLPQPDGNSLLFLPYLDFVRASVWSQTSCPGTHWQPSFLILPLLSQLSQTELTALLLLPTQAVSCSDHKSYTLHFKTRCCQYSFLKLICLLRFRDHALLHSLLFAQLGTGIQLPLLPFLADTPFQLPEFSLSFTAVNTGNPPLLVPHLLRFVSPYFSNLLHTRC